MKKTLYAIILCVLIFGSAFAQHSDPALRKIGYLTGNNIGLSFYNDGEISGFNTGVDIRGEWPLGSGYTYIGDMTPIIGVEFQNSLGQTHHSVSISRGPRNHQSDEKSPIDGHFWGWNPLPGFVNPSAYSVAMSHLPASWPTQWADHPEYGSNVWNGLFGPDSMVAHQEAYFQMSDDRDDEFNGSYYPDSTDLTKKGMGINVAVRYFQLNDSLFNDVLIRMYDITNKSTHTYNKVIFGTVIGTLAGGDGDSQDDLSYLNQQYQCIFSIDGDGIGNQGQQVAVMGEALLESPGNSHDGIDNDGDSNDPTSHSFVITDFDSIVYNIGDQVALIDPNTYQRTLHTISALVETVYSMRNQFIIHAGITQFREGNIIRIQNGISIPETTAYDGIDNDLDGLIDENQAIDLEIRTRQGLSAIKHKNYISGAGLSDPLIDEARDEIGMASFDNFNISASPDMSNDELLWDRMRPGKLDVVPSLPQDGDDIYGTNYFSLMPGEIKRIVSVIAFGYTKDEVGQKILLARALWNSKFNKDTIVKSLAFSNLNYHKTLSGTQRIEWTSSHFGGTVDLWYSSNNGETWALVDGAIPNTGTYQLNTTSMPNSSFGIIKMYGRDEQGSIYTFVKSHDLTINNGGNSVPYMKILYQGFVKDQIITNDSLIMQCLINDAESDSLTLKLSYSNNDGATFSLFNSYRIPSDTLLQDITINLVKLLNSNTAKFRLEVFDEDTSFFYISSRFKKQTQRDTISVSHHVAVSGFTHVPWSINIVDSSRLTGHDYQITFDDRDSVSKTYKKYINVYDISTNNLVVNHQLISQKAEYPEFDGLTFYNEDIVTDKDSVRTGWSGNIPDYLEYYTVNTWHWADSGTWAKYNGYPMPNDYAIIFYPSIVDTSLADTLKSQSGTTRLPAVPTNFRVKNLSTNQFIHFGYKKNKSTYNVNYIIYFREDLFGVSKRTWYTIQYYSDTVNLPIHDTLFLYTNKGLSVYDTIYVFNVTTAVGPYTAIPTTYRLEQNYPNPFNPATHFEFQVPNRGLVTLKVYDMLGREVATILNEVKPAGTYNIPWNANGLASGVYFYQLKAGAYVETKKLVLVR